MFFLRDLGKARCNRGFTRKAFFTLEAERYALACTLLMLTLTEALE